MKRILFSLIVLATLSGDTQNRGLSYIGLCHESVTQEHLVKAFKGADVVGLHFLNKSFNKTGCPAYQEFSKDPRPMVLHISLINGAGLRNRRLQKHEWLHGYTIKTAERAILKGERAIIRSIRDAARDVRPLIAMRDGLSTVIRIKPILESDFSRPARRLVFRYVEQVLPGVELIDNPVKGRCLSEYLCETHGLDTAGDIVDLDGVSAYDINLTRWTKETSVKVGRFIWIRCNNGLAKDSPWVPPLERRRWCLDNNLAYLNRWLVGNNGRKTQ